MATTTTSEEERIQQYLAQLASRLDGLPPQARQDEVMRIRMRIAKDLSTLNGNRPVEGVDGILRHLSMPTQAPAPAATPAAAPAAAIPMARPRRDLPRLSLHDALWLGVCAAIAQYFAVDARYVRAAALVFGLFMGPIALLAYVGAYLGLRAAAPSHDLPAIEHSRVLVSAVATLVSAVAVYAVAQTFVAILLHVHAMAMAPYDVTMPSRWLWFTSDSTTLLYWALACLVPLAALSAMPLHPEWRQTLGRVTQAGVALYGIVAAYGLACLFVGVVLSSLGHLAGVSFQ